MIAAAAVALAGCGEKPEPSLEDIPAPRASATTAPDPEAGEVKAALRDAAAAMEAHFADRQRYTADRSALEDFPRQVEIAAADAQGYRLEAKGAGRTFTLRRGPGGDVTRECAPADPDVCPGGRW
jgi:hypothetical protein